LQVRYLICSYQSTLRDIADERISQQILLLIAIFFIGCVYRVSTVPLHGTIFCIYLEDSLSPFRLLILHTLMSCDIYHVASYKTEAALSSLKMLVPVYQRQCFTPEITTNFMFTTVTDADI